MKYSKELKVGVIALVTMFAFWWLFQFLKGRNVFATGDLYYINYTNVDGLQPTKPVTINGLRVGKVESIEPVPQGKGAYTFKVKIMIDRDFLFNKGTIAEIWEPGLMAGKEIRLILSPTPPLAKPGDFLDGKINASLTEVLGNKIAPMEENITSVLRQLDSTLIVTRKVLNQTANGELSMTIHSANSTLGSIKNTSDQASQLIATNKNELNSLLKDANSLMKNLNGTVGNYNKVATKINSMNVEQTLGTLEQTLTKITTLLDQINKNEGSLGKILKDESLYNNLNETTTNLNSLLKNLNENPKKYFQINIFGKKDTPQ